MADENIAREESLPFPTARPLSESRGSLGPTTSSQGTSPSMTTQPSWTMPVCSRTGGRPRPFLWCSSTTHGVGIGQATFSVEVLVLKPNQNCYHHGSHQSHVGPSLRSSRARSPRGRTEPVRVLGGPQRPGAFQTLEVHRRFHLAQSCHLRVASRCPDPQSRLLSSWFS